MKKPTCNRAAPRAPLFVVCALALGTTTACGELLGFDDKNGAGDDGGAKVVDDSGVSVDGSAADTSVVPVDGSAADTSVVPVDGSAADTSVMDAEAGPKAPAVSGTFVSGGASQSGTSHVRGQFSWAPSHVVTNGSLTVSGGFH